MIHFEKIVKTYPGGTHALKGVDLHMEPGDFLAVTGSSGSGKTTLMNMVGLLDHPDSGKRIIDGQDVDKLRDRALCRLRGQKIGFIFQSFNLLPGLTALENVMLPLSIRGVPRSKRRGMALDALTQVGLADRAGHKPSQLSGGQQQRVGIARVIACRTPLILADEPTGSLDPTASGQIMDILEDLNRQGTAVLLITHDMHVAARAGKRLEMRDGILYKI